MNARAAFCNRAQVLTSCPIQANAVVGDRQCFSLVKADLDPELSQFYTGFMPLRLSAAVASIRRVEISSRKKDFRVEQRGATSLSSWRLEAERDGFVFA
jgi:hypothetical protein